MVTIMTNTQIQSKLNSQLTKEIFSAYLYLAIANYYSEQGLDGFTNWFEVQAKEELDHALLIRKYLLNQGAVVTLEKITAPDVNYTKLDQALCAALAHERMITASIGDIYTAALDSRDYGATQFLDWFVKEQIEEEKNSMDLCKKFELFGEDVKGLYMLNAELLTRIYAPPSLVL